MSSASFSPSNREVPKWLQHELRRMGASIGSYADGLTLHHAKHVLFQEQWSRVTTPAMYLADAKAAITSDEAWIVAYDHGRRGALVNVVVQTARVVPGFRHGSNAGPWMLVVYSIDTATIVTAYMVKSLARIRLTGDVVWLK